MVAFSLVALNMRLYIRNITFAITAAKDDEWVLNSDDIKEEIRTWLEGRYVQKVRKWLQKGSIKLKSTEVHTDASNVAAGLRVESEGLEVTIPWPEGENLSEQPIHIKEAYAVWYTLKHYGKKFRNRKLNLMNDNMAVVLTMEHGSKKDKRLNKLFKSIHQMAFDHNISLGIEWVSTKIQKADWASRQVDSKEAIIRKNVFEKIQSDLNLKFTIDAMAMPNNTKCEKFISLKEESTAWKHDFFSVKSLELEEVIWIYPPKPMAEKAYN